MNNAELNWSDAWRVVSRPDGPIAALSVLVDNPADLDLLVQIEALTNPLAREAARTLATIPTARRYSGAGAGFVMTPFVLPMGSRFSDGSYGVLYAANAMETALRESGHHQALRLRATAAAAGSTLRMWSCRIDIETATIADVRRRTGADAAIYDPISYAGGRALGRSLRREGHDGVRFDSVRHEGGECAGLFWPDAVKDARPGDQWLFSFDGERIAEYARVV